jgi:competence protein ComEA
MQGTGMIPSTSRPLWGWTARERTWLTGSGTLAALALAAGPWGTEVPDPPAPTPCLVVDPNRAPPEVLAALPKLGPALVGRIVEARDEAPFRSLEDFDLRVRGIGPATLAALRPHLEIERTGPGPAPPSAADDPTTARTRVARSP